MHNPPPPPAPRTRKARLPAKAKQMKAGEAWKASAEVIACIRAYGRSQGWKMVQKRDGSKVWFWRLS